MEHYAPNRVTLQQELAALVRAPFELSKTRAEKDVARARYWHVRRIQDAGGWRS